MSAACFVLNVFGNTFNIIFVSCYESSLIRETLSKQLNPFENSYQLFHDSKDADNFLAHWLGHSCTSVIAHKFRYVFMHLIFLRMYLNTLQKTVWGK